MPEERENLEMDRLVGHQQLSRLAHASYSHGRLSFTPYDSVTGLPKVVKFGCRKNSTVRGSWIRLTALTKSTLGS